jgi:hypothetical protein
MTAPELVTRHFNANAGTCRAHRSPLSLQYEGGWFIDCGKGCMLNDSEGDASPTALILRFEAMRQRGNALPLCA